MTSHRTVPGNPDDHGGSDDRGGPAGSGNLNDPKDPGSIDPDVLARLRCPIAGVPLRAADGGEVDRVNEAIESGDARDHLESVVQTPIDGGLVSDQANRMYPIRDRIPTLIADESIDLESCGFE